MEEQIETERREDASKTGEVAGTEVQENGRGEPGTEQARLPLETELAEEKTPELQPQSGVTAGGDLQNVVSEEGTSAKGPTQTVLNNEPSSRTTNPDIQIPVIAEPPQPPIDTLPVTDAQPSADPPSEGLKIEEDQSIAKSEEVAVPKNLEPKAPVETAEAPKSEQTEKNLGDNEEQAGLVKPDIVQGPKDEPKVDEKAAQSEDKPPITVPSTEKDALDQGPKKEEEKPATGVPQVAADVAALENRVKNVESNVWDAKQEAVKAAVIASRATYEAGMEYLAPIQIPPNLVQQGPPPVDAARLEAQGTAINLEVQRRREEQMRFQAKQLEDQRDRQQEARDQRPSLHDYSREESPSSPQERAMPPRRAASARAAQNFRRDQDDYLSESPAESPSDSPQPQKKTPPKPKPPPVAKPTVSKDSGADAWEEPPQKQLVLKMTDITKALQKKWLQLYWPDDGKWWPCQVVLVDPRKKTANVLYETGEEEADLGLAELVQKGEVAWLNASDAKKDEPARGRPGHADEYDEPSTSKGRGRKPAYDDDEEDDDDDDDEGWGPGRKRRAAQKPRQKFVESEPESSESESLPPSDQSSDWHSSEDEDKPKRRPKKKKRPTKPAPRMPQPHHHHPSQARDRHGMHGNQPISSGGNMMGRGGIFDDGPGFGGSFGNDMRMQSQRNPNMGRDQMQGWAGMGGANKSQGQYPGGNWNRQSQGGLDHMLQQNRQQMNNGNMGQLHIPQVPMQGGQILDLTRYQQASQGMRGGPQMGGWRPPASSDLMGRGGGEWAAQMQNNPLFRLQMQQQQGQLGQLGQQGGGNLQNLSHLPQIMQQQMLQQQQHLQQQRIAQQQQSQQAGQGQDSASAQRPNLGASTKNMEGIVAQGLNVAGKGVEVQQANGQWQKGTIMAVMGRGPQGGSALVHFDNGDQKQCFVNDEGRTYNIRMAQ